MPPTVPRFLSGNFDSPSTQPLAEQPLHKPRPTQTPVSHPAFRFGPPPASLSSQLKPSRPIFRSTPRLSKSPPPPASTTTPRPVFRPSPLPRGSTPSTTLPPHTRQLPTSSRPIFVTPGAPSSTPYGDLIDEDDDDDRPTRDSSPLRKKRRAVYIDLSSSPEVNRTLSPPRRDPDASFEDALDEERGDMFPASDEESLPSPIATRTGRRLPFTPVPQREAPPPGTHSLTERFRSLRAPDRFSHMHDTLPADWSPTKKRSSNKYEPDGLAATVAGWVLETRNTHRRKEGGWFRVVDERPDDGMVAVRGVEEDGALRNALLVAAGKGNISGPWNGPSETKIGSKVEYEYPWWEIVINEEQYRVLLFWRVVEEPT